MYSGLAFWWCIHLINQCSPPHENTYAALNNNKYWYIGIDSGCSGPVLLGIILKPNCAVSPNPTDHTVEALRTVAGAVGMLH